MFMHKHLDNLNNLMKNFLKRYAFDLLFILLLSLTPLLWFKGNTIMVGHDNVFPLDLLTFFSGRLFAWIEQGLGRSQVLIMGTIPTHFVDILPSLFGFSLQTTQKIVYVFWFFMIGLSAYILASTINKESRIFKLTAVILYQFNFFILQGWWIGERTKFSAYIAFPLVLAVFFKVYRGELKVLRAVIYNCLILFIFNAGGLFGIPLFGGYFIGLGAFILFFSLLGYFRKRHDIIKKLLLLTLFTSVGFFLVNAYYIFPALSGVFSQYTTGVKKTGGVEGLIGWASEISANASYLNLFRLQGIAEWYDNIEHPYAKYYLKNPILIALSFLWLVFIFLALFLTKKKEKLEIVFYLFLVYLLGVFFAAGTHPPFGFLYAFLMKTIPGFVIFRSPYFKFAPSIFLANAFLIAFFVDYFKGWYKKIFFVLIISFVLGYYFPYFIGDFFSWRAGFSTRNTVPDYVFSFGKWAEKNGTNGRILMLPPTNPGWQYDIYKWGYLSFQSLPSLVTNQGIVSNDDKINNEERQLVLKLYSSLENRERDLVEKLTDILGIKFFLVRNDVRTDLEWAATNSPDMYRKILTEDFKLRSVEKFGEWEIYEIANNNYPKFFLADRINTLKPSDNYADTYYDLSNKEVQLFLKTPKSPSLDEIASEYILGECLNCRNEVPPNIDFSTRLILPDSFLYQLLMFKEKQEAAQKSGKELIYYDLGISTKRIGETLSMFEQQKKLKENFFDGYIDLLRQLSRDFQQLYSFDDKFETAQDVNYFLQKERGYLRSVFGSRISGGELAQKLSVIFGLISDIEDQINPYLFKLDSSNNRFYKFSISNPGDYEIFLKKDDILSVAKDKSKLKVVIDDKDVRELELNQEALREKWFSFGKINVSPGERHLLLTIPELPNLAGDFKPVEKRLTPGAGDKCFSTDIRNFDNKKAYKVNLEIDNNFSENFYMYTLTKKEAGLERVGEVAKFEKHFEADKYQSLVYSQYYTKGVSLYFCSANLNSDILQSKIRLTINEVIHPILMFVPQDKNKGVIMDVSYQKINPTKYFVNFDNPNKNSLLVFNERFDNEWKLSGVDNNNHFSINGYANGWLINGEGKKTFVLEYKPQLFFYAGIILSGSSIVAGLLYLIIDKRKKYDI